MLLLALIPLLQGQAQTRVQPAAPSGGEMEASGMASTYMPIESWVYSAVDRLAAAGYIQTAFVGLRPWTRMDFARLIVEAQEQRSDAGFEEQIDPQILGLMKDLSLEFAPELRRQDGERNREARIESIDFRSTTIHGTPLTDGFHTAQTIVNDYGRAYGKGENSYTGLTARATYGPFAAYIRAEAQQSALAPQAPATADAAIAAADFTPTAALGQHTGFTGGRVIEAYVSYTLHDNQFTFGKQSLWWGPGNGGPLLMSNNAAPLTMLRYDRVRPFEIPGPGRLLGPIRLQAFVGRLTGQQFIDVDGVSVGQSGVSFSDQPFIHGEKASFKPTPDFEFSVSRTTIFAGKGAPFTTHSFLNSLFSVSTANGQTDPGDRRVAIDAQYRLPGLRNWLTGYIDAFSDDEPFPLVYPSKSAWSPGLYLSHVPHLSHLDVRVEGFLTPRRIYFPGFYYFNVHYLSGYTNNRELMGSWIGRESDGFQLWSTWWLSSRSSLQASVRHATQSAQFLHGGNLLDLSLSADIALKRDWQLRATAQEERWWFPLLSNTPTHNLAATIQLSYRPAPRSF
ncbi:capsule assembly Wzi family protein [Granulicella mallensis]|uniref:Capsule assembly protein Wzi n=1 Tax=Granulicella mallensis TaxID=940614 RepID=A0A7W7ZUJ5_9BACT|nr:capsule assembly Wzi family protein [Granulicella mallensis]MBB5066370.1 hypothetical protein [Granulicella mallensis]